MIKKYFEELQKIGVDYLYEAKVIIVGEGGAGKTTLAMKILNINSPLPHYAESTRGIDIRKFEFLTAKGNIFRVNLWDFGGQEIYTATHQFFLTRRALYILLVDSRQDDSNINYWLNVIELLGNDSPILIVINEKDDRTKRLDEHEIKERFTQITGIRKTNLKTLRGFDSALSEIKYIVQNLPHVGDALPKVWVDIRHELENLHANYISASNYFRICEMHGVFFLENALVLSQYFHDLGVFLHFQDNPVLKGIVILNMEWATIAVYKVLEDSLIQREHGMFDLKDISRIWQQSDYHGKELELLQLMKKFELIYELDEKRFIAPQLLRNEKPQYSWNEDDNIIIRLEYGFMPKNILHRFIVRLNRYIKNQNWVWRQGVILERNNTVAEIIEKLGINEIRIRLNGEQKKEFLTIILEEFNIIHSSFHNIRVQILIPCNCSKCKKSEEPHFYKYSNLIKRLENGKNTVECYNSFEDVSVYGLIGDVEVTEKEKEDILKSVLREFGVDSKNLKRESDEK